MNKILSDWKHSGIAQPSQIPEKAPAAAEADADDGEVDVDFVL